MAKTTTIKKRRGLYNRMTLAQKRGMWGIIFLLPWMAGVALFFAGPVIETVRYSFSEVTVGWGAVDLEWVGLDNYVHAFTVDPFFNRFLLTLAFPALFNVAVIVISSLLAAILINGKFFGRSIVRTIFFVPIIMGAALATQTLVGEDVISTNINMGFGFGGFSGDFFITVLQATGLPADITGYVNAAISGVFTVLAQSGVPILIFLAGLQAIPESLYEVATIEGSNAYESFWKVTIPMISPMILLSVVYTVVEQFARHGLPDVGSFLGRVNMLGATLGSYGMASAQVVVFMAATLIIIGLLTWIISKGVFYYD